MDDSIFPSAWQIPVDYKIKCQLALSGGDLRVFDAYGTLAFRVEGRSSSAAPRRLKILFDAAGAPLITVAYQDDGWQGFRGNSWESKDLIFTAQKKQYSPFKTEVEVSLSGGDLGDPKSSFTMRGSPFQRSCTIYKGDSVVAQTNPLYKLRKVIYSRRKFRLTVFPGNDHALFVALVAVFFGGKLTGVKG